VEIAMATAVREIVIVVVIVEVMNKNDKMETSGVNGNIYPTFYM
jgi:uncharacterized membrane protein